MRVLSYIEVNVHVFMYREHLNLSTLQEQLLPTKAISEHFDKLKIWAQLTLGVRHREPLA
jgi:hypothetical protein